MAEIYTNLRRVMVSLQGRPNAAERFTQRALARDPSHRYTCLGTPMALWRRQAVYELSFASQDEATRIHPMRRMTRQESGIQS